MIKVTSLKKYNFGSVMLQSETPGFGIGFGLFARVYEAGNVKTKIILVNGKQIWYNMVNKWSK